MHKNVAKCNETLSKWCKNKHGASKIIDTFETYQGDEKTPAVKPIDFQSAAGGSRARRYEATLVNVDRFQSVVVTGAGSGRFI
jgi:hypothetical protein